jgi:hypothetical protein
MSQYLGKLNDILKPSKGEKESNSGTYSVARS